MKTLDYDKGHSFRITEDHLKLLNRTFWEFIKEPYGGHTSMNYKRPYGNSDVLGDVCEIIGSEPFVDHNGEKHYSSSQYEYAKKIHSEMPIVLTIISKTQTVYAGTYECVEDHGNKWVLV